MADIAKRFKNNPILVPAAVRTSHAGLKVECLLNPGAFEYKGRIWLLMRVAERPEIGRASCRERVLRLV